MWRADNQTDCDRWCEVLDAYLDAELAEPESRELEEHLGSCFACRGALRFAEELRDELRSLPMFDAPAMAAPEPAVARFPQQTARSGAAPRWRTWVAAAGLGMLVLTISWWLASGTGEFGYESAVLPEEPSRSAPQDLQIAEEEARLAFAYISRAGRRAGIQVRDTVLREAVFEPVVETLARSLAPSTAAPAEGQPFPQEGETS